VIHGIFIICRRICGNISVLADVSAAKDGRIHMNAQFLSGDRQRKKIRFNAEKKD